MQSRKVVRSELFGSPTEISAAEGRFSLRMLVDDAAHEEVSLKAAAEKFAYAESRFDGRAHSW